MYKLSIITRRKKLNNSSDYFMTKDIVILKKKKNLVVEKLGSFDVHNSKLVINFIRFIFWMSKNLIISKPCLKLLNKFKIFDILHYYN